MCRLLACTLSAVVILLGLASAPAVAQEPQPAPAPTAGEEPLEERVEELRRLPPERLQELREALERFRSMPPERRKELRERARRIGPDRLRSLRGRNVERLRRRHERLESEVDRIVEMLGGEERFRTLGPDGLAYLRHQALRRFQSYFRARVLQEVERTLTIEEYEELAPAERRERVGRALRALETKLFAELSEEEREELAGLSRRDRRERMSKLLLEFRARQYDAFARRFDRFFVVPLMLADAEQRETRIERWRRKADWHAVRRVLAKELRLPRSTLELVRELGPAEQARVRGFYEERRDTTDPAALRALVDEKIRELHGRAASRRTR